MALKVGELYASFGIDTSGLNNAISGIEKKCQDIANSLSGFGKTASLALTTPITLVAKNIYKAGSEFEAQMSKVGAISGATGQDFDTLTQKAIEMGSTTSFTATEAGEALEYMAMAGWKTDAMLAGLKPVMDLAAASGESLGTTSDIVTDALTAFGLTAEDTGHFADVLAAASTNANTNVGLMGESFKYVAPMAGSLGYSIDDVAIALGIMANNGIKGSQAGTSLQRILQNMVSPTKAQAAAMEKLGLSLTDSKGNMKSLRAVMGDMRLAALNAGVDLNAMQEAVAELDAKLESGTISEEEYVKLLAEATGGSTEFLQAVADLAGARGLSGMLSIMNSTEADFGKLTEAIRNCDGAAAEMAARMLDNVQGDMTLFKSAVEGLEVSLFTLASGGMREVIQKATEIINAFHDADSVTQVATMKMAGLAAAAGPVALGLSKIISFLPKVVPLLQGMIGPFGIVTGTLALFAAAAVDANNDIGRTFSRTMVTIGKHAKIYKKSVLTTMQTISQRIPRLVKSINTGLNLGLPGIIDALSETLHGAMNVIADNASSVISIGQNIIMKLSEGLKRGLPNLIPAAVNVVSSIASAMISNIPVLIEAAGNLVTGIWQGLKNTDWGAVGKQILDAIGSAVRNSASIISGMFSDIKAAFQGENWSEIGQNVWDAIKSGIKYTGDWLKDLLGYTPDTSWSQIGAQLWSTIKSGISDAGDWLKEKIGFSPDTSWGEIGGQIWETIKTGFTAVSDWGKMLILGEDYTPDSTWSEAGRRIWETVKGAFGTAADITKQLVLGSDYTPDASWSQVGSKIWDKIKNGIKTGGELIKGLVLGNDYEPDASWGQVGKKIWEAIKGAFGTAGELVKELILGEGYEADPSWSAVGKSIWEKIKSGIGAASELIKELVLGENYEPDASWSTVGSAIWEKIKSGIQVVGDWLSSLVTFTPGEDWSTLGGGIWDMIKSGVSSAISAAGDWIKNAMDNAGSFVASEGWTDIGGKIINKILEAKASKYANVAGFATDLLTEIVNWSGWSSLSAGFKQIATTIINSIANQVPNLSSTAVKIIEKLGSLLSSDTVKNGIGELGSIAETIINGIASAIPGVTNAATDIITALGNLLSNLPWEESLTTLQGIGTSLMGAITKGIQSATSVGGAAIDSAGGIVESLATAIGNVIAGINWEDYADVASGFGTSVVNMIVTGASHILEQGAKIATAVGDAFAKINWSDMGASAGTIFSNIWDAIVDGAKTIVPDMTNFFDSISRGIAEGGEGLGTAAQTFTSQFLKHILDPENLEAFSQAGLAICKALALGITELGVAILDGAVSVVEGIFLGLMEALGLSGWSDEAQEALAEVTEVVSAAGEELNISTQEIVTQLQLMNSAVQNGFEWDLESLQDSVTRANLLLQLGNQELIDSIGDFETWGWMAEEKVTTLLATLIDTTASETDRAAAALALTSLGYGDMFRNNMTDLDAGTQETIAKVAALFDTITNETLSATDRAAALFELIDLGIEPAILENIPSFDGQIESALQSLVDAGIDLTEKGFTELAGVIPESMTTGIENGIPEVEGAAKEIGEIASTANELANIQSNATESGNAADESLKTGIDEKSGDVTSAMETVVDDTGDEADRLKELLKGVSEEAMTNYTTSLENGEAPASAAMDSVGQAVVNAALAQMNADTGYSCGNEYITGLTNGLAAGNPHGKMASIAKQIVENARQALSNSIGYSIGLNFAQGLANGILAGRAGVAAAAAIVAASAAAAAMAKLQIGSPSRLARDEIGAMFDKGLALGLLDNQSTIISAANRVTDALHDSFFVGEPSRDTVYTARQNALETEQAIVRAAGSKALQGSKDDAGQRTVHVMLELNGETIAETFVPIVDDTMMAQMKAYSRR